MVIQYMVAKKNTSYTSSITELSEHDSYCDKWLTSATKKICIYI